LVKYIKTKRRQRQEEKAEEDAGGFPQNGRVGKEARELEPSGDDPEISWY